MISFVMATHNRREVTLSTLEQLFGDSRPSAAFEVIVVDNASTDGTVAALQSSFPDVRLIPRRQNLGSCAKTLGVSEAQGEFVVFLDDDSHPRPGAVDRMLEHFEEDAGLGAAGFRVHLPNGREECSAFPNVFIGCGVGFRADALREVGGLDATLFMQAEEYDLSFRLVNAGWSVRTLPDLHVDHLKTPCARRNARTVYYDTRNNLLIAARYLPGPYYRGYRDDWLQRYSWLAAADERLGAYCRGATSGWLLGRGDRRRFTDRRLKPGAFETLFRWGFVADRVRALASAGARRVVFADLGKNVLAFANAARESGISVLAIGDDRFAGPDRLYRGTPIKPLRETPVSECDAIVVSNTSPVHAAETAWRVASLTDRPVCDWFGRQERPQDCKVDAHAQKIWSTDPPNEADNTLAAGAAPLAL